ncbi:MAG: ActR/PrrA/RegA family redox response regulator transcription factor [Actinomycetota bacterium]
MSAFLSLPADERTLLVVDDDDPFRTSLARAMERRGFIVRGAASFAEAVAAVKADAPAYAVVDLRLGDGNGLELVSALRALSADLRIVMLTGYGNIASAVSAVKAGAIDYLPKPVEADRLKAVLVGEDLPVEAPAAPMTPERVRWEHIQRVFEECGRNVSETARRLRMHRRTLQRILGKHAPP